MAPAYHRSACCCVVPDCLVCSYCNGGVIPYEMSVEITGWTPAACVTSTWPGPPPGSCFTSWTADPGFNGTYLLPFNWTGSHQWQSPAHLNYVQACQWEAVFEVGDKFWTEACTPGSTTTYWADLLYMGVNFLSPTTRFVYAFYQGSRDYYDPGPDTIAGGTADAFEADAWTPFPPTDDDPCVDVWEVDNTITATPCPWSGADGGYGGKAEMTPTGYGTRRCPPSATCDGAATPPPPNCAATYTAVVTGTAAASFLPAWQQTAFPGTYVMSHVSGCKWSGTKVGTGPQCPTAEMILECDPLTCESPTLGDSNNAMWRLQMRCTNYVDPVSGYYFWRFMPTNQECPTLGAYENNYWDATLS